MTSARSPWRGAAGFCLAALALTSGCVTTIVDAEPPVAVPIELNAVVIPFEGGPGKAAGAADQYYESILRQMAEALAGEGYGPARQRDYERLQLLLAQHSREDAPEWAQRQLESFRRAAAGLGFQLHAVRLARVALLDKPRPIGADLRFEFSLGGMAGTGFRIGGPEESTSVGFLLTCDVEDTDALGGKIGHRTSDVLRLPAAVDLGAGGAARLPFEFKLGASGAVIRTIKIRVELLPGSVEAAELIAPVRRVVLCDHEEVLYPAGVEPIRGEPLKTMRNAIRLGDTPHFRHQYLAAHFMTDEDRAAAVRMQIDQLRLGDDRRGRIAMACLKQLTGEELSVRDRAAWLAWWQDQGR